MPRIHSHHQSQHASGALKHAKPWTHEKRAKKVLKRHGEKLLEKVIKRSEAVFSLSPNLGLSKRKVFKICLYLETTYKHDKQHHSLLKPKKTDVSRLIEYDPKTHLTFIHLEKHGIDRIGRGHHKTVTLSILYGKNKPELVANCSGHYQEMNKEVKRVKKIGNHRGIANTYAITKHPHHNRISIIQRLYTAQTMGKYQKKILHATKVDRAQMSADFVHGLAIVHKKGYAHRDLHHGNVLVNNTSEGKRGALTDFGQMMTLKKAQKMAPKIEVPRRLLPPEALIKHKHHIDVKKVEVFAAGLNLYHLFFETMPEWSDNPNFYRLSHLSKSGKRHFKHVLQHEISKWLRRRRHQLEHNPDSWGDFGRYILKMCKSNPRKRPKTEEAAKKLDKLVKKIKASRS